MSKKDHSLRGTEFTNQTEGIYSGVNQTFSLINFFTKLFFRRSRPEPVELVQNYPLPRKDSFEEKIQQIFTPLNEEITESHKHFITIEEIAIKAAEFEKNSQHTKSNGTTLVSGTKNEIIIGDKDHDNIVMLNSTDLDEGVKYAVLDVAELIKIRDKTLSNHESLTPDSEGKLLLLYRENSDRGITEVSSILVQDGKTNTVKVDGLEIPTLNFGTLENNNSTTNSTAPNPTSMPTHEPSNNHNNLVGYIVGGILLSGFGCALYCCEQKFRHRNRILSHPERRLPTSHPVNRDYRPAQRNNLSTIELY